MKTSLRIMAVALAVLMLALVVASCGTTLSGTYKTDSILGSDATMKFSGSKVTVTGKVLGGLSETSTTYKYSIKDDKITFTDDDGKETTQSFEKGDGFIKVGGVKYNKQ